ncbi:uncharacterized protein LOC107726893 [Sinocyclocheilus rhinocerous]|uniref:uncharacterized protein LOC107726893 n=1 Tax=Sinocyclocheilus rhinocerous TaxID=307959 RepID=UPI0007B92F60|nr:PREDICTED: uncharacterized protein LOC107726893 [Sinocyclocheilus rhinocerous]
MDHGVVMYSLLICKKSLQNGTGNVSKGQERFCKGYGSGAFSATDTLTFGKPITLKVVPKDVPATPPFLSILSPLKGDGQDICLAAGFFPEDKTMTLTVGVNKPVSLTTSEAPLFKSTKTYYYAGFNGEKMQKCEMDGQTANKTLGTPDTPDTTEKPQKLTPQSCQTSLSTDASEFINTGDPKMNSMNLLVTGLRILLAKCVTVNALMTVKAFIF